MKNLKSIGLLLGLCVMLASCEKSEKKWENYYGFKSQELVGSYSFSNIPNVFDAVAGTGRYACDDAIVRISLASNKLVFDLNCPREEFSLNLSSPIREEDDLSIFQMTSGMIYSGTQPSTKNLTVYVMKNANQQIRLHGFANIETYKRETNHQGEVVYTIVDNIYYYFDVIKN